MLEAGALLEHEERSIRPQTVGRTACLRTGWKKSRQCSPTEQESARSVPLRRRARHASCSPRGSRAPIRSQAGVNPADVLLTDVWIVDSGAEMVFQYLGAASRTSGSQRPGRASNWRRATPTRQKLPTRRWDLGCRWIRPDPIPVIRTQYPGRLPNSRRRMATSTRCSPPWTQISFPPGISSSRRRSKGTRNAAGLVIVVIHTRGVKGNTGPARPMGLPKLWSLWPPPTSGRGNWASGGETGQDGRGPTVKLDALLGRMLPVLPLIRGVDSARGEPYASYSSS